MPIRQIGQLLNQGVVHRRRLEGFPRQLAPAAREVGHSAVAAVATLYLDLSKQRLGSALAVPGSVGIAREGLVQRFFKGAELAFTTFPAVFGQLAARRLEPLFDRVARQPCELLMALLENLSRSFMRLTLHV